nr:glutamate--tRNA ligase [Campylobacterota bacterium]
GELAKVYLEEARTINEIKAKIDTIFSTKQSEAFTKELEALKVVAHTIPYFKTFDEFKAYLGEKSELEDEQLNLLLPLLLTGTSSGPSLRTIYPHIKNYLGEIIK